MGGGRVERRRGVQERVEGMINSRWEEGGEKGGGGTREGRRDD